MQANTTANGGQLFKVGGFAALYLALSYLTVMLVFLVVLKYPGITSVTEKVQMLADHRGVFFGTNLLAYVLFCPALVLLILALRERLHDKRDWMLDFASLMGLIWAGSLAASGMVANAGIAPVTELFEKNSPQALTLWQGVDSVATGLGNGNGEVLGGLFTLFISLAALRNSVFHPAINVLGIVTGFIGLLSLVPSLLALAAVFGLAQAVWFVAVAFSLLMSTKTLVAGENTTLAS